jgi:hypothetical protein
VTIGLLAIVILAALFAPVSEAKGRTTSASSSGMDMATGFILGASTTAMMSASGSQERQAPAGSAEQVTVSFLEGGRQHISGVKRFERRMWVRDPTLSGAEQFRVCADEVRPRHYGGGHICRTYKGGLLKRVPSNNATQSVADFLASQHAVSVTILAVQILKDEIYVHFEQDTPQNLAE